MANPQKENGFTPIANEILEKVVNMPLLGAEFRIMFFIIRKTYGYHKKQDRISLTQFEQGTSLSRPTIVKAIKNLMVRNMIVKIYLPGENTGYSFVKDHEKWVVNTYLLVKGKWQTSKDVLTETSKDVLTHKRKKDNTKEIAKQSFAGGSFVLEEKLSEMEKVENSPLDIIATFIREKPVTIENSKQLSSVIARYSRVAKNLSGAYTNQQIFKAVKKIKEDNALRLRKGQMVTDFTLETIYKQLTK